jgi:LPS-assembly protein
MTGSLRVASDRTFLRRYDITRDDRLRSKSTSSGSTTTAICRSAGWATQALLVPIPQGTGADAPCR